jgi:Holliday junction DNA helicase RuvB
MRLLRRTRDYAQSRGVEKVDTEVVWETMKLLGVDKEGLEEVDRLILKTLLNNFGGGPIGLSTLAASILKTKSPLPMYMNHS